MSGKLREEKNNVDVRSLSKSDVCRLWKEDFEELFSVKDVGKTISLMDILFVM